MILDNIRRLKKKIDKLQLKCDCFSSYKGIRYDKESVQSSLNLHATEDILINHIMDCQKLDRMKDKLNQMIADVPMDKFTERQQDFIRLFYFQGLTQTQCCKYMKIKISAVCRIKQRVVQRMFTE